MWDPLRYFLHQSFSIFSVCFLLAVRLISSSKSFVLSSGQGMAVGGNQEERVFRYVLDIMRTIVEGGGELGQ